MLIGLQVHHPFSSLLVPYPEVGTASSSQDHILRQVRENPRLQHKEIPSVRRPLG